jgi:UDPglucose 6-dehydrogenase
MNPDRIVIGTESTAAAFPYVRLFEQLQKPVVFTSRCNAELIKGCSNAFLALKVTFANEVANLCDATGAVADDVLRGIGYDHRIGRHFLVPGIGFGGPCFTKDLKSIRHIATQLNTGSNLFDATLRTNDAQPKRIVDVLEALLPSLGGAEIGVWGLSFKGGTDDLRDSLALIVLDELSRRGAKTNVFDPAVHIAELPPGSRLVKSALDATEADALVVVTDWPQFAEIDPSAVKARLRQKLVIDGRNVLDAERYREEGVEYYGVGRPNVVKATVPSQNVAAYP